MAEEIRRKRGYDEEDDSYEPSGPLPPHQTDSYMQDQQNDRSVAGGDSLYVADGQVNAVIGGWFYNVGYIMLYILYLESLIISD